MAAAPQIPHTNYGRTEELEETRWAFLGAEKYFFRLKRDFFQFFFGGMKKSLYLCIRKREQQWLFIARVMIQGRSPVGLERCSHIAEVIGSSPIVPTLFNRAYRTVFLCPSF